MAVNGVYILAFRSLALQAEGLLAPRTGLVPVDRQQQHLQQLQQLPSSLPVRVILSAVSNIARHISRRSHTLQLNHLAWVGAGLACFNISLSLLLPAGVSRSVWQTVCCFCQFLFYLAFRYYGREFMAFQWDVLLLETGFICCFGSIALAVGNSLAVTAVVLMLRLLLFKVLFSSGIAKCSAAASHWRELSALNYHYWTQPLPSPGAWHAYWSRGKRIQSASVLFVELVVSFCVFSPASLRIFGLLTIAGLALCVLVTGNVGFLSHLVLAISVSLLDDRILGVVVPRPASLSFLQQCLAMSLNVLVCGIVGTYFLIYSAACLHYLCKISLRGGISAPSWAQQLCKELSLICACNAYGLFSVITTGRFEIVIEELHITRDDKPQWLEITCPYKPGDINASPPWLWTGHFPRLDWRLWFVPLRLRSALGDTIKGKQQQMSLPASTFAAGVGSNASYGAGGGADAGSPLYPPFWPTFLEQLCARQPAVLQLLGQQGEVLKGLPPPKSLRISLYDYRMAPPEGLPLYASFFPEGWAHLNSQEILKLEDELTHWTVGRWWMRRQHQIIDVLNFSPSRPAAEEAFN